MRNTLLPVITLSILVTAGCVDRADNQLPTRDFSHLSPCELPDRAELSRIYAEALCGFITVPENPAHPDGRQIDLNIMVIPAGDPVAAPDPVFFLAGGPGQAATEAGPALFARLPDLRRRHDVVLVDQRGTGGSNAMPCELGQSTFVTTGLETLARLQRDTLKHCLAGYDADPTQYNTNIAMDDLDLVRQQLGYGQINLYGISYGTRAALVYLRTHGDHVRSVILDSVVPMNMLIPANVAVDAQRAFDQLLADCNADADCSAAFPLLPEVYRGLLRQLEENPANITLTHPRTGEPIATLVEARLLGRIVRSLLYDRQLSALLPLAIHQAAEGNFQPLLTMAMTFGGEEPAFSPGMMASVLCAEDLPRTAAPNETADFDNPIYRELKPLCDFWPARVVADNYFLPVVSDVPTLLFSGTLDPITPPAYGIEAAATLSISQHVIVPGVGHGASIHGCAPDLLTRFLESADPVDLDTSCVADLRRPPFFVSYAGTLPPGTTQ